MATNPGVTDLLDAGLRAATLRSKTIANNIANMNTPGYRRQAVQFEDLLAKVIEGGKTSNISEAEPQIVQPMTTAVDSQGNDVSIDTEVGDLIENGEMVKTYLRLLNKMYSQVNLAISGT